MRSTGFLTPYLRRLSAVASCYGWAKGPSGDFGLGAVKLTGKGCESRRLEPVSTAMDPLMRKRESASPSGGPVLEAPGDADAAYETALSQALHCNDEADSEGRVQEAALIDSRSPKEEAPVEGLVASPFHSDKVHAEVELLRNRPATLDGDAQRVSEINETGLGDRISGACTGEPQYFADEGSREATVRVARLEGFPEGQSGSAALAGGIQAGRRDDGEPLAAGYGVERVRPHPCSEGQSGLSPELRSPGSWKGGFPQRLEEAYQMRPFPGDSRELVPAIADGTSRLEALLLQVMEENRSLRMRVDQMETQSSWHSGRTQATPPELEAHMSSPVSLMNSSVGASRPTESRSAGIPPLTRGGPQTFSPPQAQGGPQAPMGVGGVQKSMVVQGGSLVSGDLESRELVHYQGRQAGLHREGHEPREPSMEFDRRVLDPVLMPPVPKPILLPVEPPARLNSTGFMAKVLGVHGMEYGGVPGYEGESVHNQVFHTLRGCGSGNWGVDCQGYPVSPGGTVIRPPPIPPPREACRSLAEAAVPGVGDARMQAPNTGVIGSSVGERPEEPAKYISELPKLPALDVSTSAVACGNWMAQLRQVFAGLSPSALVWYQAVEMAATKCYQRWLVADPLDRLSLDPGGVVAVFDEVKFQRVESRAVSLMLAAIPQSLRDEAVSNRWLTTASLLFRVQCVYQPGGSSERSTLLRQLTLPETVSTVTTAVAMLRKWQQHFYRVRELGASMPDPLLLLAGVDKATAGLLGQHPALGFRVNAFRHRVALDYNPTVPTVVQLVRLIQAECEALALGQEGQVPDRKARAAAARAEAQNEGSVPKAPAVPKGGEFSGNPGVKALEGGKGEKGKGKGKGKFEAGEPKPCFSFDEGKGCKFGDSCRFRHDRVQVEALPGMWSRRSFSP